jgi:hypothetical protein
MFRRLDVFHRSLAVAVLMACVSSSLRSRVPGLRTEDGLGEIEVDGAVDVDGVFGAHHEGPAVTAQERLVVARRRPEQGFASDRGHGPVVVIERLQVLPAVDAVGAKLGHAIAVEAVDPVRVLLGDRGDAAD